MPTTEQELTPLLRRLKRQIVSDGDFRSFVERVSVEEVIKGFAAGAGMDACDLLRSWAGVRPPEKKRTPPAPMTDDDDEPVMPDHDDGDDDGQETKICPTCNGRGRTHDGRTCPTCGGSGRVPLDDVDDEDDKKKRSLRYEFEDED
jgi:hypothetical protein